MKKIIFTLYMIVAFFVTITLFSYNEFKVTEFGTYSLVIITDNGLAPEFNKGDLLIVDKADQILAGRKAFFYDTANERIEIRLGLVENAEKVTDTETTYTFEGERKISGEYVLGPANTVDIIPVAGTILGILQSKFGFLFIIVLPALIAFVNQIGVVYSGVKQVQNEEKKNNEKDKE